MCESVSVDLIVQWRPQKLVEAPNVDHLNNTAGRDQTQPKRGAMGATIPGGAMAVELPYLFGVHHLPQISKGAGNGTGKFNVCPLDFGLPLFPFPAIPLFITVGIKIPILCH